MPPKPASAARTRFTTRKRIPAHRTTIRVGTKSNSPTTATATASATTNYGIPAAESSPSSESSLDAGRLRRTSCTVTAAAGTPHTAISLSQAQLRSSREILAANLGVVTSADGVGGSGTEKLGNSFEQERSGAGQFGSGKTLRVEDVSDSRREDESKTVVNLSSAPALGPQVVDESSVKPLTVTESGASGVAGTGSGKRKVVRKIVRVVKKVIKKKVPKRILRSGSGEQGLTEKARDELNVSAITQILDTAHDVAENFNVIDEINEGKETSKAVDHITEILKSVNEANVVETCNEVMEKANIADIGKENLEFVNSTCVLEPTVGEKGNDPSRIDSIKTEMLNFQFGVSVPEQKVDESADDQSGVHAGDANSLQSNDARNSAEVVKVEYDAETVSDAKEVESSTENQAKDYIAENSSIHIVNKENVGPILGQNVGPVGENDEVSVVEKNEIKIEKQENANEKRRSDGIRLSELLCSGEMEALQRRKRPKTEIFVGGLNTYAKEDDIRKVFDKVGTIMEVRLVMNGNTGKNKGYAFVRFSTAADAKNALDNYSEIEICGKQCGVAPYVGNDTLFLGNLDRNWKIEDVVRLLEEAGLERIDKVTLKVDSKNIGKNRGFAFVEFETCKDAQIAFQRLQKKDAFGKNLRVKVDWAQPLIEPDEQEMLKVKSVYAEYLPSTWDGEKVKEFFERFGEIENVVLTKDLPSSRRKDSAFINYKTRDGAITCVEAMNREQLEDGCSKVKMVVSLAKPFSKSKQLKHTSDLTKQHSKAKPMGSQMSIKLCEPRKRGKPARSGCHNVKVDKTPSTNDELVQILRQQVSSDNILSHPRTGPSFPDYDLPVPGSKRPFSLMAHGPHYVETRGLSRVYMESSYPIPDPSSSSYRVGAPSFPYRQEWPSFTSEPVDGRFYLNNFQEREQAPFYQDSNVYRRY